MKRALPAIAALAAGVALAAPTAAPAAQDGAMTGEDTVERRLNADFAEMDVNGDDRLTSAEFSRAGESLKTFVLQRLPGAPFVALDRNADGFVSREEYVASGLATFAELDSEARETLLSEARTMTGGSGA